MQTSSDTRGKDPREGEIVMANWKDIFLLLTFWVWHIVIIACLLGGGHHFLMSIGVVR